MALLSESLSKAQCEITALTEQNVKLVTELAASQALAAEYKHSLQQVSAIVCVCQCCAGGSEGDGAAAIEGRGNA